MNKDLVIGCYCPETKDFERGYFRQGFIFKSYPAYEKDNEVCYIPELSDYLYTRQDFLDIANGNQKLADYLFENVDWQCPETLLDELETDEADFLYEQFNYEVE